MAKLGKTQLIGMFGDRARKNISDSDMRTLIDSLWRDNLYLYGEVISRDPAKLVRNQFADNLEFGQAIGQDHSIAGNLSIALGIGHATNSYREILMGSYAADVAASATEWVATDRLWCVGNGVDLDNRHDAFRMYKSGYSHLDNALRLGAFSWGALNPEAGALQYTPLKGFEGYLDDKWEQVALMDPDCVQGYVPYWDGGSLKKSPVFTNGTNVLINTVNDPGAGNKFAVNGNSYFKGVLMLDGYNSATSTAFGSAPGVIIKSIKTIAFGSDNSLLFRTENTDMGGMSSVYSAYSGGMISGANLDFYTRTSGTTVERILRLANDKSATFLGPVSAISFTGIGANITNINPANVVQSPVYRFVTDVNKQNWDMKQSAIALTTSGTSGPATFINNVLNIPQYLGGETDPVFSAWNKSTGISISHDQISDWASTMAAYVTGTPWMNEGYWSSGNHPTTTSGYGLPAYPTTLPASDVYAWAKSSTKPTYTYTEVGAAPASTVSFPGFAGSSGWYGTSQYAARADHSHAIPHDGQVGMAYTSNYGVLHSADFSFDSGTYTYSIKKDTSITSGSSNPVTSGAVYSALQSLSVPSHTIQNHSDVYIPTTLGPSNANEALVWGGSTWNSGKPWASMGYLTGITKAQVEAVLTGTISSHSHAMPSHSITSHSDVSFTYSPSSGDLMQWNGSAWTQRSLYNCGIAALAGSLSQAFSVLKLNLPGGGYIEVQGSTVHIYSGSSVVQVHGQVTADSFYKN